VLVDVRGRAHREREIANAWVEGDEDDRGVGEEWTQLARDLEAGLPRHRVIEHDEIGPQGDRLLHAVVAVNRFADDDEISLGCEQGADPFSDGEVVVDDQYAACQLLPCPLSAPTPPGRSSGVRLVPSPPAT